METTGNKVNTLTPAVSRRHAVQQKLFNYLCLLLVFCTPIHFRILPPLIALIALNWLIDGYYIRTIPHLAKDQSRLLVLIPVILYLAYLIGMSYTRNLEYGWFDLQVKLSLFLFPLFFSTSDRLMFDNTGRKQVLNAFIAGCIAGSLLLLTRSVIIMYQSGDPEALFYRNLSWYFHPTYLALYFNFAIVVLGYRLIEKKQVFSIKSTVLPLVVIVYFFVIIFLLSSKAGILSMILLTCLAFVYLVVVRRILLRSILMVLVICAGCFLGFKFSPILNQRFQRMDRTLSGNMDSLKSTTESNAERLVVWRAAGQVILHHPVFGTGTGDVKDALMDEYRQESSVDAFRQKLNAHNQYLQTAVALGLPGLALLLGIIILPAILAFRKKDYIFLGLMVLFSFNILFESMLEVQAGTVFFGFFLAFFLWLLPGSRE